MAFSVTMPRLGESVTEGTVTRWLKKEGDQVAEDEPLLEVSTDKVDTEIPSPISGVLAKITVAEDETVEVGAELAVIEDAGAAPAQPAAAAQQAVEERAPAQPAAPEPQPEREQYAAPPPPAAIAQPQPTSTTAQPQMPAPAQPAQPQMPAPVQPVQAAQPAQSVRPETPAPPVEPAAAPSNGEADTSYVTPLVRKLAAEHDVDLTQVSGTGVGGRIRKQDVLAAAEANRAREAPAPPAGSAAPTAAAPAPSALRGRTEKMSRLRSVLATRMVASLHEAAQLTSVVEADVTRLARLRDEAKADFERREGVKLSFLPFFALATVEALKAHPSLNASIDSEAGTITYHDAEHLGIAVDTDRGLLVPVVRDAGDLNLGGLARRIGDLANRTRASRITPDEMSGGTFTITNTGSRGVLFDTPILFPPQVGILGTGVVVKRPVVIENEGLGDTIAVRSMVYLALTYDHRLVDGADAARFLATVKARLEEGRFEADLGL